MRTVEILTRYSVIDPIQYSNKILYFYFYENGNLHSVVGDFGNSVQGYKMNEAKLFKTGYDIYYKGYCLLFPNGRKVNLISKEEAEYFKNEFNKLK